MADYNKTPPYTKRLQVLLSDPAIKTTGPSVSGIQSLSSLQAAFMKKLLINMLIFSRIETSTEELTNVARVIELRCYDEEAIVNFHIASVFQQSIYFLKEI